MTRSTAEFEDQIENTLTSAFVLNDHGAHSGAVSDQRIPRFQDPGALGRMVTKRSRAHSGALGRTPLTCDVPLGRTRAHDLAKIGAHPARGYGVPRVRPTGPELKQNKYKIKNERPEGITK